MIPHSMMSYPSLVQSLVERLKHEQGLCGLQWCVSEVKVRMDGVHLSFRGLTGVTDGVSVNRKCHTHRKSLILTLKTQIISKRQKQEADVLSFLFSFIVPTSSL